MQTNERLNTDVSLTFLNTPNRPSEPPNERDRVYAQQVAWLFRDSFQTTMQTAGQALLNKGEQQKWRPVLRDAHGKVVHSPGIVLLNPLSLSTVAKTAHPIVRLVPSAIIHRRQAPAYPTADLIHEPLPDHEHQAAHLFTRYLNQKTLLGQTNVQEALAQYRFLNATIDPARPQAFRRGLDVLVSMLPAPNRQSAQQLVTNLMQLHPLYRSTYHPDISATGHQRIEQSAIPLTYKGVVLQPKQIRNLLLGNTIEVAGIRDPKRNGLYRAGVSFNILHGRMDEVSRQEQLRTDNRQEAVLHRRTVGVQNDDSLKAKQFVNGSSGSESPPKEEGRSLKIQ